MALLRLCDICREEITHSQDLREITIAAPENSGSAFVRRRYDLCPTCGAWLNSVIQAAENRRERPCVHFC
ncbi:MAG: hypothetical protein KKE29_20035 [Proteobacteria bacterium]|nr:hypothetical protein [Pseudomonadota bacterium]MBU4576013.1 hypothetical protein [Pseudomonadota bacterium]MBV1715979.1 hypothetical protein [Desulfarculus sp.]